MKMTCGHEAKKGIKLVLKMNDINGKPFVRHGTYCEKCADEYKSRFGSEVENE